MRLASGLDDDGVTTGSDCSQRQLMSDRPDWSLSGAPIATRSTPRRDGTS